MRRLFERNIFDEYKLYCEQRFKLGEYEGFVAGGRGFLVVSIEQVEDRELNEIIKMASHLYSQGDQTVGTVLPTRTNQAVSFIDGQNSVLFQLPLLETRRKKTPLGRELAELHRRGRSYQVSNAQKEGWKDFWMYRLSQLDQLYERLAKEQKKNRFDKAFMTSFPYYLGLTENAIQYIVDSDIDLGLADNFEQKTICHFRFTNDTWLQLNENNIRFKNPIDLVYDYPSRDLAEWIRFTSKTSSQPFQKINKFLDDYGKDEEISPRTWRFIYARLLFPVHYFQVVEGYYRATDAEERDNYEGQLYDIFLNEEKNESFLRQFQQRLIPSYWQRYVPEVDWLKTKLQKEQ